MKSLKKAFLEAKEEGKLDTDKIWVNFGYRFDYLQGKTIDDYGEFGFSELPESVLNIRVSKSEYDKGAKFYWIEDKQFCVGKDGNTLDRSLFISR